MSGVRNSLFPFLAVSTAFHLVLVLTWGNRPLRPVSPEEILVKLLPPPAQEKAPPRATAPASQPAREPSRDKPTRAELPPGQHAKNDRAGAEAPPSKNKTALKEKSAEKPLQEKPADVPAFETADNEIATVSPRGLPTLKELLPPVYRPNSDTTSNDSRPVRLDSRDPVQKQYMDRVKQALYFAWDDPRVAPSVRQPYGIEAKAIVEFVITEIGKIEDLHLIRSSGYSPIDEELIRVVIAAAPNFGPIPRAAGARSFRITLTMTFENLGKSYSFSPR